MTKICLITGTTNGISLATARARDRCAQDRLWQRSLALAGIENHKILCDPP